MRGWRRTFWVVFVSNLISGAGLMSFLPFFPTLLESVGMRDAHQRALWSGLLFGAAPLSAAFMGPLWGSIGDRYGRKLMVVRSLLGLALFVGAMSYAHSAWQLLFLRIGQGVFSGYIPPSLTLVSVAAPRALQGRVTSWLQTASTIGTILGPLLGALLLTHGAGAVFTCVSVAAGASAFLVWLFAEEDARQRTSAGALSLAGVFGASWRDFVVLFAHARLREALLLYAAVFFALGATNPQMEFLVEALWRGDPARIEGLTATLFSSLAIASIVATPLWGRLGDRLGHAPALRLASGLSALVLLLHAFVPAYGWLLAARIGFGCFAPGASASAFGLAATETPNEQRGAAMGAVFSVRSFALSAGSFLGGALTTLLGLRGLFAAAGAVVALTLLASRWRGARAARASSARASPLDP